MRPSDKQVAAYQRNDKIRRLRGMWANAKILLSGPAVVAVQVLIDLELKKLGAEGEAVRRDRVHKFWHINPDHLPSTMTREQYDELDKNLFRPFGRKR